MVEVVSVADLVKVVSGLHTRFQAPHRQVGFTRYLRVREARIRSFLAAEFPSNAISVPKTDPVLAHELAKHPALGPASSSHSRLSSFFDYLKIVARSDAYARLTADLHCLQNDGLLELLLNGQANISAKLDRINMILHIIPCQNVDAARRLLMSPFIRIRGLDRALEQGYYSLAQWCHPNHDVGHTASMWNRTPVAATLFGREQEVRKFAVLVGVATALTAAHEAQWYHRRLAADNIFIRKGLNAVSKLEDILHRKDLVRVTDFYCPVTGCFDGCLQCKSQSQREVANAGDFFNAITKNDSVLFSVHSDYRDGKNGEQIDSVSFARLIVWIYAGSSAPVNFESTDTLIEDVISRVPWPLRWIVRDCKDLPMRIVYLFLNALQNGTIRPHCTRKTFVKRPVASPTRSTEKVDAILYQTCVRCVVMGAETEEPEALVHMAKLWEGRALFGRKRGASREKILQDIRCAYECYRYASLLGESDGFLHMARLQSEGLRSGGYLPVENTSSIGLVHLLIKAAACGNSRALKSLRNVAQKGVSSQEAFASIDEDEEDDSQKCFVEKELIDAIVEIAMCIRRGTRGFPVDHNEALHWLQAAKERLQPKGCLELGLLKVQLKESAESVREGVSLVSAASNAMPAPASYDAHFWLGKWYRYGLTVPSTAGSEVIVCQNSHLAVAHVEAGLENDHPGCMASYSMFLRDGVHPLKRDEGKAKFWNKKAREKQSPMACYGYAVMKVKEAKAAYKALDRGTDVDAASFASAEDSTSPWFSMNQSSSSSASDSQQSPWHESYQDASGSVTRAGIARLFEVAFESLTKCRLRLSVCHPEESENPKPLVMAAEMIYKNITNWAACAYENEPEMEQLFRSKKLEEANKLLQTAMSMDKRLRWEQLRVDYREEDLTAIRRAAWLLEKYSATTATESKPQEVTNS